MSGGRSTFDINQRMPTNGNDDVTVNKSYLESFVESSVKRNNSLMQGVDVVKTSSGKFEDDFADINSLVGGQFLSNKTKEIIDSCKRLNDVLKAAEAKRKVDLTSDEEEHLDPNAIASSLSEVHAFVSSNGPMRVRGRR